MKMIKDILKLILYTLFIGTNALAVSIPYRDDFESALVGTVSSNTFRGTTNSGTLSVITDTIEGDRALKLTSGKLTILSTNINATNIWIQLYTKPTPVAGNPQIGTNAVIAFCVFSNGALKAYNGNTWVITDLVTNVQTNVWLGFILHLDYVAKKWDIFVGTNNYFAQSMKRANSTPLNFNTTSTSTNFAYLSITNTSTNSIVYIDVPAVYFAYTNTGGTNATNILAADRLTNICDIGIPPYTYIDPENTIAGQVGDDLKIGLLEGDKLEIFYTNGWNTYTLNSSIWIKDNASTIDPNDMHIFSYMGMSIKRTTGVDTVVFYPYGQLPITITNIWLRGQQDSLGIGWNKLTSPFSSIRLARTNAPADVINYGTFGFLTTNYGDRIYFDYDMLYWSRYGWREGSLNSSNLLYPGQSFWYYHKGTGMWWNITE